MFLLENTVYTCTLFFCHIKVCLGIVYKINFFESMGESIGLLIFLYMKEK